MALVHGAAPISVTGDRPFILAGADAWYVLTGRLDVFTVRLEQEHPVGSRSHLLRAEPGQVVFGTPSAAARAWGLLAVGEPGTQVQQFPQRRLLDDPDGHRLPLVEGWLQALYEAVAPSGARSAETIDLVPGQATDAARGARLRPRGALLWVSHLRGHSRIMGQQGLVVEGTDFFPLCRPGWLEFDTDSRVLALETRDLSTAAVAWSGFARFYDIVLHYAELRAHQQEQAWRDRMRERQVFQAAVLQEAHERLADRSRGRSRHQAGQHTAPIEGAATTPLFAACATVGGALGLVMRRPPDDRASESRDALAAILRASRIRGRRVALRGRWWHSDNGPLLGFLEVGRHPVALLRPAPGRSYVVHDPLAGTERPVDDTVARELEALAWSFYRPFAEQRLSLREVLRFGVYGSGRDAVLLAAVITCGSLLATVPTLATATLFNTVVPGAQRAQLVQLTLVLLACAIAVAALGLAQGIALLRIESRASAALQSAVWDRLLTLPATFFRAYTAGDLAVRAMSVEAIRQLISGSTISALVGVVLALGNFALMFFYSWKLALWGSLAILIVLLATLVGGYLQLRPQADEIRVQSKTAGLVLQLLTGISKLRVAAAEVTAFALWARLFGEQRRLQYQARSIANWIAAFSAAVPVISFMIIFSVTLPMLGDGVIETGDFLAFLTAFSTASGAMVGASTAVLAMLNVIPLYEQARPILESLPEVDVAKSDPGVLIGEIEMQHASFRYQADGPMVLNDVSFRISPGQFVAFVGPSGSGKSTILRLLLGFEMLDGGTLYYDGREISGIDLRALRRQLGVVLQNGRLMSGDIFTNIVGASGASVKDAWEAARLAGLADDIEAMPMGIHTVVSEGATTLSGGQRQRLLIARAIVNRPRILLLDEATSALDNRTQSLVSASLEALQATRIVIAHRLSTIVRADQIFVLERGQIVQRGTYQELLAQSGPFLELVKRQLVSTSTVSTIGENER